jgi:hypothetical protein
MIIDHRSVEMRWWGPRPEAAPTLVLPHEGLGCVALRRDLLAALVEATGCGVFAWSRFGYGGSDSVSLPRPMRYMHDEAMAVLPRVLDAADVRRAVLVGHSKKNTSAATCGRVWRAITATWMWRSVAGMTQGLIRGFALSTPRNRSRASRCRYWHRGERTYGTEEQLRMLERTAMCPVETRLIAGARHAPHLEARKATLNAIVPFVRSVLMAVAA